MNEEIKNCQNCRNDFTIESEDFSFYEKIKVPPPTWCPTCRMVRRMAFMNERTLYKRTCDKCKENMISLFPQNNRIVYCSKCWWQDNWGAEEFGREYDFSKSFFYQFAQLAARVPEVARLVSETTLIRSDYCNLSSELKDCYLITNSNYSQDCCYGEFVERSNTCIDASLIDSCELCYDITMCNKCYKSTHIFNCSECVNVHFSRDLSNCQDCFGCVGLRGKQYCFFNRQLTKSEYEQKLSELAVSSYTSREKIRKEFEKHSVNFPRRFMTGTQNMNVTGDSIFHSKNVLNSYEIVGAQDSKYCSFITIAPATNSYDLTMWGAVADRMYECMGAGGGQHDIKFCFNSCSSSFDMQYSWYQSNTSSSHLFACIGLRNKQYCILNKQYSKEEYEELVPKIIAHMNDMPYVDAKGRTYTYGEFFPPELSPFAYNETIAQEYFPLTKEEAIEKGYRWRDPDTKDYKITTKPEDLPDHIKDVSDSITKEIIECSHVRVNPRTNLRESACQEQCTTAFKIIPQELQFYRQMNLPLPRLCPNCRHYERLKQRNPLKLWHRACQCAGTHSQPTTNNKQQPDYQYANTATHTHGAPPAGGPCPTEFETSYAPDRPEIIYCGSCYNAEVA